MASSARCARRFATTPGAIAAPQGAAALRAIEQHANLSVRLAVRDACRRDARVRPRAERGAIERAIASLDGLVGLAGPTVERHNLRGGCYKRLASILHGEQAQGGAGKDARLLRRGRSAGAGGGRSGVLPSAHGGRRPRSSSSMRLAPRPIARGASDCARWLRSSAPGRSPTISGPASPSAMRCFWPRSATARSAPRRSRRSWPPISIPGVAAARG